MKLKKYLCIILCGLLFSLTGCSSCNSEVKNETTKEESSTETESKNSTKVNLKDEETTSEEDINLDIDKKETSTKETTEQTEWTETFEDSDPQMVLCGKDPQYFTGTDVMRPEVFMGIEASEVKGDFEVEGKELYKFENVQDVKAVIGTYLSQLLPRGYELSFEGNNMRIYMGQRASVEFEMNSEDSFTFTIKSEID